MIAGRMIEDWDDAYANAPHIPGGEDYPPRWPVLAQAFRATMGARLREGIRYGAHPRQRFDLFLPEGDRAGLLVFVHGGYWRAFDRSDWSHLAAGALERGWAVAIPGYVLAPEARIAAITAMIREAIAAAADEVAGPIRLAGHSAGGHLVARQLCADSRLPEAVLARVERVVPISGLHDLRPFLRLKLNETLRLDLPEARAESPALLEVRAEVPVHVWVGADERPVFRLQSKLLADVWSGLGLDISLTIEPARHHFSVIDGLPDPGSDLVEAILGGCVVKSHARVVVIGGGVVGCSVLYHLVKAGWTDAMLIERSELTSGSSWHAAGGFHTLNGDPNVAKLQAYTVSLYGELEEISGQSCSLHLTGGVMLAGDPVRMDFLRLAHAKGRCLGMDTEIITPGEAAAMFPLMDPAHFVGALWDPVEGHLDPSGTTHAYAKAAQKLGATIVLRNRVVELTQEPGGAWNVVTEHGTIETEHVVNAGGLWAREIGRMVGLELPVLAMEHMYLLTEPMPEIAEFNARTGREMVGVLDLPGEIYTRQERGGVLLGTYEKDCRPWSPKVTPWEFGHELLQPDLDRIAPSLEVGFRHFPPLENAGIKQVINGPFTFAPDGNPLVGPVQGLTNFWVACGVMAGFSQGGGVGLVLANWMTAGDPGHDIFGMDVARFGEWATLRYTNAKVRENYARRFSVRFPNEELAAARPQQATPLYDIMTRERNAVMGVTWGLEVPLWFAPEGEAPRDELSFHRSNDFRHVGEEVRAVRERVGVTEIANFAKYAVTGRGAESWLDHTLAGALPRTGRIALSPMLNEAGKLIGDFTLAKAGEGRFFVWGSSAAQIYHMRWFEAHLPADGSVQVERLGMRLMGLMLAGPRSREVLAALTDHDVSNTAFRFMDHRPMGVAGCPAMVNRLSYTGDLGYEIWVEPAYLRTLYRAVQAAGAAHGLVDFGMRALLSMRLEKNWPTWFAELRPIYGAYEGAMERFVRLAKGDFIGREAAAREAAEGPRLRRVSLAIEAEDADVMGDEPIWARVERDYGAVGPSHGYGGDRFDAEGHVVPKADARRDGDWRVAGWVTSGGYGHTVGLSLAQGYLPAALAERDEAGLFEVEILGVRRPARIAIEAPFDPDGLRMRG